MRLLEIIRTHPRTAAAAGFIALLLWLRLGPIPADLLDDRESAVHGGRRSRRNPAVRSALRRGHAQRQADSGGAAAVARCGNGCGGGSPVLVASRRRPDCHASGVEAEPRRAGSGGGRIHDHAAGRQAAAESTVTAPAPRRLGEGVRGRAGAAPRAPAHQARGARALLERRGVRQPGGRGRARQPPVFRAQRVDADAGAGRVPGRAAPAPVGLQPLSQPRGGARAAAGRAPPHDGGRGADGRAGARGRR